MRRLCVLLFVGCAAATPAAPDDDTEALHDAEPADSAGENAPPEEDRAIVKAWVGAGAFTRVYPTQDRYINDHSFIKAADGTWHMFGITGTTAPDGQAPDSALEKSFAHATAPTLQGPWTTRPDVLAVDPSYFDEAHVWAPHVIESGGKYFMFYAGGVGANAAMNLATSSDLFTWTRLPSGPLFRDGLEARDPYVTRIGDEWVMYYCATEAASGGRHVVAYRRSSDLIHWSTRAIAYTDRTKSTETVSVTESPVVVKHGDDYFLFIGPRGGYVGTDVYRSSDPLRFDSKSYAGHIPSHAPEVIEDGGRWWVSASGWFQRGIDLAPLEWRDAPSLWPSAQNPAIGGGQMFALDASGTSIVRWSGTEWETFGEGAVVPTIGENADGRLSVFTVTKDGEIRHRMRSAGSWSEWESFGTDAGAAPVVARSADGRLELFLLRRGGSGIAHRRQLVPNGSWSEWESFGTEAGEPPVVAANADGRLEVFAIAPGGAFVTHRYQTAPNGGWSAWEGFGGPAAGRPAVGRHADGRLDVFVVAAYGRALSHRTQRTPSGGWGSWKHFGGWIEGPPSVAQNADGRLEVFAIGPGGAYVSHRWQVAPNGGWSAWDDFDNASPCPPSVARLTDGRLEVFTTSPDGHLERRVQSAPSGTWDGWAPFRGVVGNRSCWSPT